MKINYIALGCLLLAFSCNNRPQPIPGPTEEPTKRLKYYEDELIKCQRDKEQLVDMVLKYKEAVKRLEDSCI